MPTKFNYTEPELCQSGSAWFVHFSITHPLTGEVKRVQKRGGINFYHKKEERLKAGLDLKKFWKKKLEGGWHPFVGIDSDSAITPHTSFCDALDFALNECALAPKSKAGYKGTVKFCKEAATKLQLQHLQISEVERPHIKLILLEAKRRNVWSNKSYNKHHRYLSAVIGRLLEWEVIKFNPAEKIKHLPETETKKYVPYTREEKDKLREYLFLHHYNFFVYQMMIYHTGMRPQEVLQLRISDIDLVLRTITILPDSDRRNSKTRKIREIPVNDHLFLLLREMQLDKFPSTHFVFGRPDEKKRDAKDPRYFSPHPHSIKRDTTTRLWRRVVIETLKIDKYQYAMKHTGADDKILEGIDLDALKELYGHTSKFMTEKYVSVLKQMHRKKIMEQSPAF